MKIKLLLFGIIITSFVLTFYVFAHAATVTAIDANDAYVVDDKGNPNTYTNKQLNQIVTQAALLDQQAEQSVQMADEVYLQWAHTQAVWGNEVTSNSFNNATTL